VVFECHGDWRDGVTDRRDLSVMSAELDLVAWLRALPAGAVVRFSDDAEPVVPEACAACGLNWCWTIVGPDDTQSGDHDRLTIVAAYDLDRAWSAARIEAVLAQWAAEHAARPDVRFTYDPTLGPSPLVADL
jgi:hypothetical protein